MSPGAWFGLVLIAAVVLIAVVLVLGSCTASSDGDDVAEQIFARHERGEVGPPTPTSPSSFSEPLTEAECNRLAEALGIEPYENVVPRALGEALRHGPTDEQRMIVRGLTDRLGVGSSPNPETTPDEPLP